MTDALIICGLLLLSWPIWLPFLLGLVDVLLAAILAPVAFVIDWWRDR